MYRPLYACGLRDHRRPHGAVLHSRRVGKGSSSSLCWCRIVPNRLQKGAVVERKLAAILAADVVGYSALMERDEAGTFERLKAGRKELFEPEIARHHGRIFKLMGDGLLAEFGSVVDAVECAVSLQRGLAERNAAVPEDQRIQVRIGINLGEVIVEGDDRYGEGVNVAARLEQLAEPGGICVSGKVAQGGREEARLRLRADGRAEGQEHRRAGAGLSGEARWTRPPPRPARRARFRAAHALAAAALILLVLLGAAGGLVTDSSDPPSTPVVGLGRAFAGRPALRQHERRPGPGLSGRRRRRGHHHGSVALPELSGSSRATSSFIYDKPVKVQQVGEDLGVSYVLEGSVQKSAQSVRIRRAAHRREDRRPFWADRYDEEGDDVAALQENVATKIVESVAGIRARSGRRKSRQPGARTAAESRGIRLLSARPRLLHAAADEGKLQTCR